MRSAQTSSSSSICASGSSPERRLVASEDDDLALPRAGAVGTISSGDARRLPARRSDGKRLSNTATSQSPAGKLGRLLGSIVDRRAGRTAAAAGTCGPAGSRIRDPFAPQRMPAQMRACSQRLRKRARRWCVDASSG